MKKTLIAVLTSIAFLSFSTGETKSGEENTIPYPEGYRNWTHVKTKLAGPNNPNFKTNGGYHHIYANALAMQGYSSGHFQNGAILIFDVIDIKEQGGNTMETVRKRLDVMVRDSLKYKSTGGWGYGEFMGDDHEQILTPVLQNQCFNCHAQKENFVFSSFRK